MREHRRLFAARLKMCTFTKCCSLNMLKSSMFTSNTTNYLPSQGQEIVCCVKYLCWKNLRYTSCRGKREEPSWWRKDAMRGFAVA